MITCVQCNGQNNHDTQFCWQCGADLSGARQPLPQVRKGRAGLIVAIMLIVGALLFVAVVIIPIYLAPRRPLTKPAAYTAPAKSEAAEQQSSPQGWEYSDSEDSLSGKPSMLAITQSLNTVNFGFPYAGEQRATLLLRKHPRLGRDAILKIERGQFMAGVDGVRVTVRFDDGSPMNFWANGSADNDSRILFLGNYAKFVAHLRKAKIVRMSTAVYQEGAPIFEFNVAGLEGF